MGVLVANTGQKNGSTISGNTFRIVVVKVCVFAPRRSTSDLYNHRNSEQ
jgi:hypothetical protein